ncbi:YggT family protein [Bifidobacterium sp. ESL0763]|uniref:YggT family protein n=1 Tax=Bifidobacterium sp. ESL0763 TaxID=2983227 RepID=UPI0023F92441|nr:YggT family protein [Bifidobacterium sp. ESL0763]MDF7664185.1 YggT family protein [Bifidobacterium sp. ESL0763]
MLFFLLKALINWLIGLYMTVLFIRVIIDWVAVLLPRWRPNRVVMAIFNVFYALTDPPLRWLRRFIPVMRVGNAGMDFTPVVLWFALAVLQVLIMLV